MPVTLFTKNGGQWLEQIAATGCVPWGWTGPPTSRTPNAGWATKVALQGNMDPSMLYATPGGSARGRHHSGRFRSCGNAMSSTWGTASIRMGPGNMLACSSTRCMSSPPGTTVAECGKQRDEQGLRAPFCP